MWDAVQKRRLEIITGRTRKEKFTRIRFVTFLATAFLILLVLGLLSTGLLFAWYAKDLPRPDKVVRTEGISTIIYDRNHEPIYDIYHDQNRIPVPFEEMPDILKKATVSIEDKDFYKHEGFSSQGMVRALLNIVVFHKLEGGSTLTQQLVKNVLLSQERTLPRKIKEFILAIQIERKYSKDQILQMYLNEAPYGSTTYGIETASQYYFSKKAKDLSPLEAIVLAGFPQSPSKYSPFTSDDKAYIWRAEQTIRRMREDGIITIEEENQYKKDLPDLKFTEGDNKFKAAHFVTYIKDLLTEKFGEKMVELGGLNVVTTLDLKLQEKAETIVKEEVDKDKKLLVSNGAAIIINPNNGEILSMVGSKDYQSTDSAGLKFNVVTQGLRQPGSALKPITYAAAFRKGILTPSSIVMDVETKFPGGIGQKDYTPKNYDLKWRGPIQLRFALSNSINMSAVKVLALTGVKDMLSLAYDMGMSTLEPTSANLSRFGLAITLGGGEVKLIDLTQAFGVFATGGVKQETVAILKVTNQKGKVLFESKTTQGKKVLGSDVAFLITSILSDNKARSLIFGENSYLNIPGKNVFVKTGTTDDKRDNWTIGGTRERIIGVWVGNNDNSPMNPTLASGVTGAAPIWNKLIKEAIKDLPNDNFIKPENIVEMDVDSFGGGLARAEFPTRKEFFIKGTEPTGLSPIYKKIKISKNNGKLANAIEIASGSFDEKEFFVFEESDPVSTDGKNLWQEGINSWLAQQTDPKYHPPTETSEERNDKVVMNITSPEDKKQYSDHDIKVTGEAFSLNNIKEIKVEIDGTEMEKLSGNTYSRIFNLNNGPHTIRMTAKDEKDREATGEVKIGVNTAWDAFTASPVPSPVPTPSP